MTEMLKMMTGLVVRGGVGLVLRTAMFGAMLWAAWQLLLRVGGPFAEWAVEHYQEPLLVFAAAPPLGLAIFAILRGCDGRCDGYYHGGRHRDRREPWRVWDFLRRAPFVCWCLITDDGRDVPLWAILSWPAVAIVEVVVAVLTLIALPLWGLGIVASAIGRLAWRVLSVRPLDRG